MSKLIIGCGYLGLRVAKLWRNEGHTVSAVTRSASRADEFLSFGINPILADVCDPLSLKILPNAETVLYAVGYDRTSKYSQQEVSVDGLRNVLNQVVSHCRRFISISSSSVYGQSGGEWVNESSVCEPVQTGGQICLRAEQLLHETFGHSSSPGNVDQSFQILRLSGIYGPNRLLQKVDALRRGEKLPGRSDAWLNLIHVDDASAAVVACEQFGEPGKTYLISDDEPITRQSYYSLLAQLVGAPLPQFQEDIPALRGSGGLNKRCSNRLAKMLLNLTLAYPTIATGLPHALSISLEASVQQPSSGRIQSE